jgi:hypothetical protein
MAARLGCIRISMLDAAVIIVHELTLHQTKRILHNALPLANSSALNLVSGSTCCMRRTQHCN